MFYDSNGKIKYLINDTSGSLPVVTVKDLTAEILFLEKGGHNVWTDEIRKLIHDDIDGITRFLKN